MQSLALTVLLLVIPGLDSLLDVIQSKPAAKNGKSVAAEISGLAT